MSVELRDFLDQRLLDIAKRRLALSLEEIADRAADALLDQVVGINKRQPDVPRHVAPDSGFATAGHADQRYVVHTSINSDWCIAVQHRMGLSRPQVPQFHS